MMVDKIVQQQNGEGRPPEDTSSAMNDIIEKKWREVSPPQVMDAFVTIVTTVPAFAYSSRFSRF